MGYLRTSKADNDTKLGIPLSTSILHMLTKIVSVVINKSAVNDVRVTSCSADFDQKYGFTGNMTKVAVFARVNFRMFSDVELCSETKQPQIFLLKS